MSNQLLSDEMQQQLVDKIAYEWFVMLSDLRCNLERDIPAVVFDAVKETGKDA
jgi:hypothetical protein